MRGRSPRAFVCGCAISRAVARDARRAAAQTEPAPDRECGTRGRDWLKPKHSAVVGQSLWSAQDLCAAPSAARARRMEETPDCADDESPRRKIRGNPARSHVAARNDADGTSELAPDQANLRDRRDRQLG